MRTRSTKHDKADVDATAASIASAAVALPLDIQLLDDALAIDGTDLGACDRRQLEAASADRRALLRAVSLTCRTWHVAASRRMFEVLEPASAVQVRSVLDQLQRAAPQVRARTRTLILAPGLMGVSGGAVARLIGLCPALETIVCDMHMISSLVRLPPIRRLFLGEAELVVIMRLLAESELEDLRVESLTRTVDGLTIAALEAARAAAFHLRRLEVAFDEIELVASADGTPDVPEGPITQLPTPFEYLCMSAYSLTHLRIAGATARPVSSALRKLRRLTLEKPPRGAGGLRVLEIVVPAEDNVRQFLRELLGFLPDTLVKLVVVCSESFGAASAASVFSPDEFDFMSSLRTLAIVSDEPVAPSDKRVAHLRAAFAGLQTLCDTRGITLVTPLQP